MDSQPSRLADVALRLAFTPSPARGPRRADDPVATVARLAMQTRTAIAGIPKKAEPAARMAAEVDLRDNDLDDQDADAVIEAAAQF